MRELCLHAIAFLAPITVTIAITWPIVTAITWSIVIIEAVRASMLGSADPDSLGQSIWLSPCRQATEL